MKFTFSHRLFCIAASLLAVLPSSRGCARGAWRQTVLHEFGGKSDGQMPQCAMIRDQNGILYGTTQTGGRKGMGTVFALSPPAAGYAAWTETVLHDFAGSDGAAPWAGLAQDAAGRLYGTASGGGRFNDGVVFRLVPPRSGSGAWPFAVVLDFNGIDGAFPVAAPIIGPGGSLFVTTDAGDGSVLELRPPAPGAAHRATTTLYAFDGLDGGLPQGPVLRDSAGNLYGTLYGSDQLNAKTGIFRLSPRVPTGHTDARARWRETLLQNFELIGLASGGLAASPNGTLYGATANGGPYNGGLVFSLAPPPAGGARWQFDRLYAFRESDGSTPFNGVIRDAAGHLYGTTYWGGANDSGTVFELAPPGGGGGHWSQTILLTFNTRNGALPDGSLTLDAAGNLYGTTSIGGKHNAGSVFELSP